MNSRSVVGKDGHTEENVLGYYDTGDSFATTGKRGLFWGWNRGLVCAFSLLIIPGVGPIMIGGPFVGWMNGAPKPADHTAPR